MLASLIALYKSAGGAPVPAESGAVSKVVTALILAGGSAGVNNVMVALGYRVKRQEEAMPRPPADKAWISIRARRQERFGPVFVTIRQEAADDAKPVVAPIAGTFGLGRARLGGLFFRNPDRFPANGGYEVTPEVNYIITVTAKTADGKDLIGLGGTYSFARRAIVDFDVTLK